MNYRNFSTTRGLLALAAAFLLFPQSAALSQEQGADEAIEEIVTTGTRKQGQSPTETLSPIDVFQGEALANQATFDLTDGLTKIAPSINTQRFPIADGTAFIRPVTLRNLSPDQTLVLVNGSRRHRSPLVNLQLAPLGTVNQGAQAVDYQMIPAAAIQRVEILRDGASAQYGSDAIAGVINIILKDADEGIELAAQTGEYFEGDGARTTLSANGGFSLGGNGFLNATVEYSTADKTSRGVPHGDCPGIAAVVGQDTVPLDGLCQRWGDPDVEALRAVFNASVDISPDVELFGNLTWADNETISDFFYRNPVLPASEMIAGRATLIIDSNGDFLPDNAPQSLVDDIVADGLNPDDYLTADGASPSGYVLLNPIASMFPGGYNPDFGANMEDMAFVGGLRGTTAGDLSWDVRARYADSEVEYVLSNSINPSLGGTSPTSFTPGTLVQEETALTADFVRPFDVGNLASPLNFAFGFEYRDETYEIGAGDPASISAGPVFIFGVGSDGFQGFPTDSAGSFSSESYAGYVDVEADLTDTFSFGAAVRYEDYDTFGDTLDGKLSGRLDITDRFALRGTVSTGFRAPTPGQINTLNVTTSADASGNLIPSGTYPVDHPVAAVLGATTLEPEESQSFTLGAVFQPFDNTSATIDVYNIQIDDRLALLTNTISQQNVDDLNAMGYPNASLLLGTIANHFANAFDSEVTGVDVAVTSSFDAGPSTLLVDLRANFNEQEVSNVRANTINQSRVFDLENQVPQERVTMTFDYQTGALLGGYVRLNYFGGWDSTGGLFSPGDASDVTSYGSEVLVDLEAQLTFAERFRFVVGGENVFDVEPADEGDPVLQFLGVDKALTSPFGLNGGFWYVRLSADF